MKQLHKTTNQRESVYTQNLLFADDQVVITSKSEEADNISRKSKNIQNVE
jgi:hypothetical protein